MNIRISIYLIHQSQILRVFIMCCTNNIISISIRVNTVLYGSILTEIFKTKKKRKKRQPNQSIDWYKKELKFMSEGTPYP